MMTVADLLREKYGINEKRAENRAKALESVSSKLKSIDGQVYEYWTKFPDNPQHFGMNMYEYISLMREEGFKVSENCNGYGVYYTKVRL